MLHQASHARETLCETLLSVYVVMRDERDTLLRRERLVQNWQQPAVRLPFEVLELIFEMACVATVQEDEPSKWAHEYRCARNAINLTCSHWREVALKATGLWSHIFVCDRAEPDALRAPMPNLIPIELERAGGRPLAFYLFNDVHAPSENTTKHWELSMSVISAELHRCMTYHAVLQPNHMLFDTFSIPRFLPLLRTLVLAFHCTIDVSPECDVSVESVVIDLTDAPSLHNLRLRYYEVVGLMDGLRSRLFFKLPKLCSLADLHVFEDVDSCNVVDAINSCPRLETLELDGSDRTLDSRPLIFETMSNLVNLSIDLGSSFAVDCIPALSAPNLLRLRVDCDDRVEPSARDAFDRVFSPSRFPALRYLYVSGGHPKFWQVLPPFITSHQRLEEVTWDLCERLDEGLCNSLSKLPVHCNHPLRLTVWLLPMKEPSGGFATNTHWIQKLL